MISKQLLTQLRANLAKLGPRRLAIMAAVGVTVAATVMISAHYLSRPAMQPIYTGLTAQDVTRMTSALAEAGVTFDVNEQRNSVLVPFGQAAKARTLLAQKGLPTSSRAGYELFDQMGTLGLTSFMQEVTRIRALEGEIARTIQALDGVGAARVHLVMPETGTFRREAREPTASVLLRLDGRWQSTAGQVVRHIVASAVPGMKLEHISVASTDGRLIATGGDETQQGSFKLADLEKSIATEIEQRAAKTLASALGPGNFQISVSVKLDIDRQQTNETIFDPKSRVERSVRIVRQSGSSEDGVRPPVGVDANLPREEAAQPGGEKRQQREDRREEQINYELNSKTVQTVREGYRIQRVAIAAVVNQKQLLVQLGSNADAQLIDARMAELKKLIAAAAGTSGDRGDLIELTSAAFDGADQNGSANGSGILDALLMHVGTIVNAVALVAIVYLVVTVGMRQFGGLLERGLKLEAAGAAAITKDAVASLPGQSPAKLVDAAASELQVAVSPGAPKKQSKENMIRDRLEALVASNEAKVGQILKSWMSEAR